MAKLEQGVVLQSPFGHIFRVSEQRAQLFQTRDLVIGMAFVECAFACEFGRPASKVGQGVASLGQDISHAGRSRQELADPHRVWATCQDQGNATLGGHHPADGKGRAVGLTKVGKSHSPLFQLGKVRRQARKALFVHIGSLKAFEIKDHEVARVLRSGRIAHRVMKALDLLCDKRKAQRVSGRGY